MPYRRGNYNFVIDSSFQPFSMQEMLTPFVMYKDAFEKSEAAYDDLRSKADRFKYLSESLPEGSRARQIYEGYANDLNTQTQDFANNGLGISNRRALTGLRQRYQGEIGRLYEAETALKKEQDLRRQLNAKDPSMLYGTDNLDIDMFLDNNTPNLYSISGNELYTRGAQLGRSISSRMYNEGEGGSVLGGLYRDWVSTHGVSEGNIAQFMAQPNVQAAIQNELKARGVIGNLRGNNLDRATRNFMQGMYEGVMYEEKHNPQRDYTVPTWAEQRADARATEQLNMQKEQRTFERRVAGYDDNGVYHPEWDQSVAKARAIQEAKNAGKASGGSGSGKGAGSEYGAINQDRIRVSWKGNNPNDLNEDADDDVDITPVDKDEQYTGKPYDYDDLPQYAKSKIDKIIGNKGDYDNYIYFFKPYKGGFFNDQEAELDIVPRKVQKDNADDGDDAMLDFGVQ